MTFRDALVAAGVAGLTFVAFLPALGHDFLQWDDYNLLLDHDAYRGLGVTHLRWMATNVLLGHYVPVTWLSFALDYRVWGLAPAGFHLTNLLLHAVNAALVYGLTLRLFDRATGWSPGPRRVAAGVAALVWAVHPLRVEAVAWVTGRRDVLSGFLLLLALSAYLTASEAGGARRRRWLGLSLAAYGCALGAKAIVMTAPLVLVALDVYPLRRLPAEVRRWGDHAFRGVWAEKLPFVLLALLGAVASYVGQSRGSGVIAFPLSAWLALVAHTLAFHLAKTLWPVGLSPLYELPRNLGLLVPRFGVTALAVTSVALVLLALHRRWPAGLMAAVWYGAFLAPVSSFTHAGPQLTADRYSYLPGLAWATLLGAGAGWIAARVAAGRVGRRAGWALATGGAIALLALGGLTTRQTRAWADTGRLWTHALAVTPDCGRCRINLGNWLMTTGQPGEALRQFEAALTRDPEQVHVRTNAGLALVRLGRTADAIPHYEAVLARFPATVPVRANLATALIETGRRREAVARLGEAARFSPPEELVRYFRRAAADRPGAAMPRLGLVQASLALGDAAGARAALEGLRGLDPELAGLVVMGAP